MEIISGVFRPIRSANQPEVTAPTRRSHRGTESTNATSVRETWNSLAIGTMISRNMVKSKASSVHPSQPATQASHWSFVGSRHQATEPAAVAGFLASFMLIFLPVRFSALGRRRKRDPGRHGMFMGRRPRIRLYG